MTDEKTETPKLPLSCRPAALDSAHGIIVDPSQKLVATVANARQGPFLVERINGFAALEKQNAELRAALEASCGFYNIKLSAPSGRSMGGWGFGIELWPAWKEAVARRSLTQEQVNTAVESLGRQWLDGCGFNQIFDPDNCGFERDKAKPPGPNATPMYEPNLHLRVDWGEWGPEHITVPGNACGLDISRGAGGPIGGMCLYPHNVDSMQQAMLLLIVFCWFANDLCLNEECLRHGARAALRGKEHQ